jgi:predicted permease
MTTLIKDAQLGLRMLLKTPLLSAVAILTVGLGVGLTTHTFSTVYGTILRGVPVPGEKRLVHVDANRVDMGIESMRMSIHDFEDIRAQQTLFEDLGAFYQGNINLAGDEGPPERFVGAFMSAHGLSQLGVPPLLGRVFGSRDDQPDASPVIVLGHHVWTNRFAQDPAIVGKSIRVNGERAEVIGVMPEGFRFPFREDAWLPFRIDASALARGEGQRLDAFGKLREGVTLAAAQAELTTIAGRLARGFPETNEGVGLGVRRYEIRFMPEEIRAIMWVMLGATFGVLLIACANVANILLARASARSREVAIRTALGASRAQVVRQLMVESAVLTALGGLLGLALSAWGVRVFNAALDGIYRPYWIDIRMDLPILLFTLAITAAAAMAAGVVPAVRASGVKIGEILKDESRGSSGLRLGRFSSGLVVTEIAVSCGLLIGAGFMIKSVINIRNVDLGFQAEGIMTGRVSLFDSEYPTPESRDQFFDLLKSRLDAEPGVVSAALGTNLPAMGSSGWYVALEGEVYPTDRDYPTVHSTSVTSDYFRTAGVDLIEGRDFSPLETRIGGDPVVIVSQSFVDRYLPDGQPLGRRLRRGLSDSERPWMTIVGVVPDIHVGGGVGGIGDDRVRPERIFVPKGMVNYSSYALLVRTQGDPGAFSQPLRAMVAELDPNLPVYGLLPLEDAIQQAIWAFGLFGSLFTIFGAAALFLAAVGLYGVMAFSVSQRRREMGVRMALGAQDGAIIGLVLGKGAVQLGVGVAIGLGLGAAMGQPLRHILYGVETGDPLVYGSVVVTLVGAGLLACLVPARSATQADPVEAMRTE